MVEKAQTFVDTLQELRRGGAVADLTAQLTELVTAVRATGQAGALMLTVKVAPASRGDVNTLMLVDSVKLKLPTPPKSTTILFASDDGVLTRQDPRQPELDGLRKPASVLPLREVERVSNEQ